MAPDYTKQLEEISRALSRPEIPAWFVAIISTILGFAAALLLQFVQHWFAEHSRRQNVRRVLYNDLAELFPTVGTIMEDRTIQEPHRSYWQKSQLRTHVGLKTENWLRANEDVYVQLGERSVADAVYAYFHRALGDSGSMFHVNWFMARQVLAGAVCED